MAENLRTVPIGEMVVTDALSQGTQSDEILVAYGLGSCVAVCLYDPVVRVGGMLHALLPTAAFLTDPASHLPPFGDAAPASVGERSRANPTKFVDQGVPLLIETLLARGAKRTRLRTYLGGGARMLAAPGFEDVLNIGERNVLFAKSALRSARLRIWGQSTGGHVGRTLRLYIDTGQVTVKTMGHSERILDGRILEGR
jgi:chemotaxis protein CheD